MTCGDWGSVAPETDGPFVAVEVTCDALGFVAECRVCVAGCSVRRPTIREAVRDLPCREGLSTLALAEARR